MNDTELRVALKKAISKYINAERKVSELLEEFPNYGENCDCKQRNRRITVVTGLGYIDDDRDITTVYCCDCGGEIYG